MTSKTTRFSREVRDRAVPMVLEHEAEHPSRWAAMTSIAAKIGCKTETLRLYKVLNGQLARHEYVAGEDYSIADMACFPWVQAYKAQDILLDAFPDLRRWCKALEERPALKRSMDVGRGNINRRPQDDVQTREILFGIKKD